eukprot:CAMPEP_0206487450 /NCGR_PEP_ID=MMETSP0324_2-20121206/41648_1 /ASSEMBLY_ACC=CAM_ASM_000836 /TAXON_ID=2866 /ORGANISM="Crypthecodinium cohnii, Strain Seligo" /LENGTH=392 /DNA_ID=CAMNT_0053965933 /DNA_START=93 /DNA_END=1271 /DNA_ORIENTATION=-
MKLPPNPTEALMATQSSSVGIAPLAGAPRSVRIESLNFPRFVVAFAIVAKHFYEGPYHDHLVWSRMGVNFFFILHGFVVHFAKTSRKWPPPPIGELPLLPNQRNLIRRFAAIWPVHCLGVLSSVFLHLVYLKEAFMPWVCLRELFFLSNFMPGYFNPHRHWYNTPLWFVGVMGWFWVLEEASYAFVAAIWRTGWPITAMTAVFSLWNFFFEAQRYIPGMAGSEWYWFTPLRFLNQYWAGIMLAMIVQDRRMNKVTPTKWMASAAVAITCLCYCFNPRDYMSDTTRLFKLNGWCTPLACLLIWGLAEGADPVAVACTSPGLAFYGDLAFAFYAMQGPVALPFRYPPTSLETIPYFYRFLAIFPTLFVVAYIVNRYWQIPVRRRIEEWGKTLPM